MTEPLITVIVRGPQGAGKTLVAERIREAIGDAVRFPYTMRWVNLIVVEEQTK